MSRRRSVIRNGLSESNWRNAWSPFRVNLVNETARCMADLQSTVTGARDRRWAALTSEQQNDMVEFIALVHFAQELAMKNLDERGLVP